MDKHLHIIVPRVPFPALNSSLYDVYNTIVVLHSRGIQIHLHCYNNADNQVDSNLRGYCQSVNCYASAHKTKVFSAPLPYVIASRQNDELINRLLEDDYPVLMHGIESTFVATDKRMEQKKKFVRLTSVKYLDYRTRSFYTNNPFKRLYYWNESRLLHAYEKMLISNITSYSASCRRDMQIYQKELDCSNISLVAPFFHRSAVTAEGVGAYTLYLGDLDDIMNEKMVLSLLRKTFRNIHVPLIIAAKNPSQKVINAVAKQPHVHMVINPDEESLQDMIAKAHITLLPSFYETGLQTGLLQALYNGRHCLTNSKAVSNTPLGSICHVADTAEAFQQRISQLYHQPFTLQESMDRKTILDNLYPQNDLKLYEWIWGKSYVEA